MQPFQLCCPRHTEILSGGGNPAYASSFPWQISYDPQGLLQGTNPAAEYLASAALRDPPQSCILHAFITSNHVDAANKLSHQLRMPGHQFKCANAGKHFLGQLLPRSILGCLDALDGVLAPRHLPCPPPLVQHKVLAVQIFNSLDDISSSTNALLS